MALPLSLFAATTTRTTPTTHRLANMASNRHAMQTRSKGPVVAAADAAAPTRGKQAKPKPEPKASTAKPKAGPAPPPRGILKKAGSSPKRRRVLRHAIRYWLSDLGITGPLGGSAAPATGTCPAIGQPTLPRDQASAFEGAVLDRLPGDDSCPPGVVEVTFKVPRCLAYFDWPKQLVAIQKDEGDDGD